MSSPSSFRSSLLDELVEGNFNEFDLGKRLEQFHFDKRQPARSIVSKAVNSTSIPDPENVQINFVYNFFKKDERKDITNASVRRFDPRNVNTSDESYQATTLQTPRFVKVMFDSPSIDQEFLGNFANSNVDGIVDEEDYIYGSFLDISSNVDEIIGEIFDKVVYEGTTSNLNFTGVELFDTFADRKIYDELINSVTFLNIDNPADSPRERAEAFREAIGAHGQTPNPTGVNKRTLVDILSELQPAGVSLAPGDLEGDLEEAIPEESALQSFSIKFNNLFFKNIINQAALDPASVYEDEIRALIPFATTAQDDLVASADPAVISELDYELQVTPISTRDISVSMTEITTLIHTVSSYLSTLTLENQASIAEILSYLVSEGRINEEEGRIISACLLAIANPTAFLLRNENIPKIKIVGYLIEKLEYKENGETVNFPPIFIDNPRFFSEYIDSEVVYGRAYSYKVRTLATIDTVCKIIETSPSEPMQQPTFTYRVGTFLFASDGKRQFVQCTESIPPPEPVNIRTRINRAHRCVELLWDFPLNKQRDIKRFQIFKRNNISEAFTLVKEYNFDNSEVTTTPLEIAPADRIENLSFPIKRFVDTEFKLKSDGTNMQFNSNDAIYAVASVDAHGLSSGYSAQLYVRYDAVSNRLINNIISTRPAPKPYPNLYINSEFFDDLMRTSNKKRCTVFFDPEAYRTIGFKTVNNFIRFSEQDFNYTFQFINVDLMKEKRVPVRIVDASSAFPDIPAANISPNNLVFNFGS